MHIKFIEIIKGPNPICFASSLCVYVNECRFPLPREHAIFSVSSEFLGIHKLHHQHVEWA